MPDRIFWDSNIWIYLYSNSGSEADQTKKAAIQNLLTTYENTTLVISSQVINESVQVFSRKLSYPVPAIREIVDSMIQCSEVVELTDELSLEALALFETHTLSWFDSLIVAAAIKAKCTTLLTEDLHDGMIFQNQLLVRNPFKK